MSKKIIYNYPHPPSMRTSFFSLFTTNRLPTLGSIRYVDQENVIWEPTEWGKKTEEALEYLQRTLKVVLIQEFIVMPNHIHMLILYNRGTPKVINWFSAHCKQTLTQHMIKSKYTNQPIWEKSFDSIEISQEYTAITARESIRQHHSRWKYDALYYDAEKAVAKAASQMDEKLKKEIMPPRKHLPYRDYE